MNNEQAFHTGNAREQIADLLTEATKIIIEPSNDGTESAPLIEKALELLKLRIVGNNGGKLPAFPSKPDA